MRKKKKKGEKGGLSPRMGDSETNDVVFHWWTKKGAGQLKVPERGDVWSRGGAGGN